MPIFRKVTTKAATRFEERITETPHGQTLKYVNIKPTKPLRNRKVKAPQPKTRIPSSEQSSTWDHNPFLDNDREALVLCDPVPANLFQDFIDKNSKVSPKCYPQTVYLLKCFSLGSAFIHG